MTAVTLAIHGRLPAELPRATLRRAAEACVAAAQRWARPPTPWREVTIHLVHDTLSAQINAAILGHEGPTDVITQRYDSVPPEPPGLVGELYVNLDEARRMADRLCRTTWIEETVLYIAHGCDHLTDADDATPEERRAMRRRDLRWMRAALRADLP